MLFTQKHKKCIETEVENKSENHLHICIYTANGNEFYADDCEENWNTLMALNITGDDFIYLKDSDVKTNMSMGIRTSNILCFYLEREEDIG